VKTTNFLIDIADGPAYNEVYVRFFPDPLPARSTFAVAALPRGARIEIEAVARVPSR
jgi:2-iminobutanoate/2-iminopropanoate deaminase